MKFNACRERLKVGDHIAGGDIFGVVPENNLISHRIMLPPNAKGRITYVAPPGEYTLEDKVIEVEFAGERKSYTMLQQWPIARAPVAEKFPQTTPLLIGSARVGRHVPVRPWAGRAIPGVRVREDGHLAGALEVLQLGRHHVYGSAAQRGTRWRRCSPSSPSSR